MRSISYAVLALTMGLVLVAEVGCTRCGGDAAERIAERAVEQAIEKGSGGKADVDVGSDVDLSGLPEFARYPGATGKGKWSMQTEEGGGSAFGLETADPIDKVTEWYKSQVAAQGWKQSATMETGDGTMLMFTSPDEKQTMTVTLGKEEGKTAIAIIYGTKN